MLEYIMSLSSMTVMQTVLGIDNLIFLAIVSSRLPEVHRRKARLIGLVAALFLRIALLYALVWVQTMARGFVLGAGGLFLLYKATSEIHDTIERKDLPQPADARSFWMAVFQIILLDLVFSFDSVFAAIGMTKDFLSMIIAMTISMLVMLLAAEPASAFIQKHSSVKILVLSFLLLIGMTLIAEAFHFEVPSAYLYFAILFSLFVEALNLLVKKRRKSL